MLCRQCGTEIADKAIVCYRCGAATTDPVRQPVRVKKRTSPWLSLVVIVATLAITAALSLFVSNRMSDEEQDARSGPRRDFQDD